MKTMATLTSTKHTAVSGAKRPGCGLPVVSKASTSSWSIPSSAPVTSCTRTRRLRTTTATAQDIAKACLPPATARRPAPHKKKPRAVL